LWIQEELHFPAPWIAARSAYCGTPQGLHKDRPEMKMWNASRKLEEELKFYITERNAFI
jgi:hypothetical protein